MNQKKIIIIFFISLIVFCQKTIANDATATIGIGGLELKQSDDISMESEDLFVSTKEIRVRYNFKNTSSKDISTIVAFPLPTLDVGEYMVADAIVNRAQPINFVNFEVKVAGQQVPYKTEVKALVNGKDVALELQKYNIPISPFDKTLNDKLKNLTIQQKQELKAKNIVDGLIDKNIFPNWKIKITFYWNQTFPAGQTLKITHRYNPIYGLTFLENNSFTYYRDPYCIDAATESGLKKKAADQDNQPMIYTIDYILTTGNHWKGPIKNFQLTIDKGAVSNIISLCANSISKTGPTTFQMKSTNYVPKSDLKVLIVGKID